MKKKRAGVRSPRSSSARPTRTAKGSRASKRREGRRQSPFHSEWKYLDSTALERSGREKGGGSSRSLKKGRDRAERSQRSLPSRSTATYYEPPPKRKPFREFTDEEVIAWYLELPGDQRHRVLENTAIWKWFNNNKRDHKKLIAMQDVVRAEAVGTPPSTTEIAAYLRLYGGPPCPCGYMGYPYEEHALDMRKCFSHKPPEFEDNDDDDLPF